MRKWLLADAVGRGDAAYTKMVTEMITRNTLARYHPEIFAELVEAETKCNEQRPAIGEYVHLKTVTNQIGTIESGATGVTNNHYKV